MKAGMFLKTKDSAREFILNKKDIKESFENLEECQADGFEYSLTNGYTVKIIIDKEVNFLCMEVFPGIYIDSGHIAEVSEYCQTVTPCPGICYLLVDPDRSEVYCRSETCFLDSPVSVRVLQEMEANAVAMVTKHAPIISCLAYGRFPQCLHFPLSEDAPPIQEIESDKDRFFHDWNIAELSSILPEVINNPVGQNMNAASSTYFFVDLQADNQRFRTYIDIQGGWLMCYSKLSMKVDTPYLSQASHYCNNASDAKKVGFLKIKDGIPVCCVATFILDTTIHRQTLKEIFSITASFLHYNTKKLAYIGHGILPPINDREENLKKLLASAASNIQTSQGRRYPIVEEETDVSVDNLKE